MPPEVGALAAYPFSWGGGLAPKIHIKTTFEHRYLFGGCFGDEGDPKESIVANWAPKMTPKWSLKWSQK